MTYLLSMLFIATITLSLLTISGSLTSSWSRIIEVIELENSEAVPAPRIHVGKPIYYRMIQSKPDTEDNVIIAFPSRTDAVTLKDDTFLPEAA